MKNHVLIVSLLVALVSWVGCDVNYGMLEPRPLAPIATSDVEVRTITTGDDLPEGYRLLLVGGIRNDRSFSEVRWAPEYCTRVADKVEGREKTKTCVDRSVPTLGPNTVETLRFDYDTSSLAHLAALGDLADNCRRRSEDPVFFRTDPAGSPASVSFQLHCFAKLGADDHEGQLHLEGLVSKSWDGAPIPGAVVAVAVPRNPADPYPEYVKLAETMSRADGRYKLVFQKGEHSCSDMRLGVIKEQDRERTEATGTVDVVSFRRGIKCHVGPQEIRVVRW
jgi:hypothetical protein